MRSSSRQNTAGTCAALALLAALGTSACNGFDATPVDPAAQPSGPHVTLAWSPGAPTGGPNLTIGAVASDATAAFAMLEPREGDTLLGPSSLWRIPATGAAPESFWQATTASAPFSRVALDADNVYWVHPVQQAGSSSPATCEVLEAPRSGAGGSPTSLGQFSVTDPQNPGAGPSCAPLGIAVDGKDVFVAAVPSGNQYAQYQFSYSSGVPSDNTTSDVEIVRFDASSPSAPTVIAQQKQLATTQLENAFALDASSLYWVESNGNQQGGPGWSGGTLVQTPRAGGTAKQLLPLASAEWPTGLVVQTNTLYVMLGSPLSNNNASSVLCSLSTIDTSSGATSNVFEDHNDNCYGLAVVGAYAYTVFETSPPQMARGLLRIPLDGSQPSRVTLDRSELALRGVEPGAAGILAVGYLRLLRVPVRVFP